MYAQICVCIHNCIYTCINVCMYIYICTYIGTAYYSSNRYNLLYDTTLH